MKGLYYAGGIFGCFATTPIADRWGRKLAIGVVGFTQRARVRCLLIPSANNEDRPPRLYLSVELSLLDRSTLACSLPSDSLTGLGGFVLAVSRISLTFQRCPATHHGTCLHGRDISALCPWRDGSHAWSSNRLRIHIGTMDRIWFLSRSQ